MTTDNFNVGNVVFPLTSTSGNSLLQDADPLLYYALSYWSTMIGTYDGARLVAAFTAAGVSTASGTITSAVMAAYPYDVGPYMQDTQVVFPCLTAFRKETTTKWITTGFEDDATTLGVQYVLPPLTAAQAELILPILSAVWKTLRARTSA